MKKYKVIVKVTTSNFAKYNVNDLIAFTKFLNTKFKDWRWFNVFEKGKQVGSFTKNNCPISKHI